MCYLEISLNMFKLTFNFVYAHHYKNYYYFEILFYQEQSAKLIVLICVDVC